MIRFPTNDKGLETLKQILESKEKIVDVTVYDYITPKMRKYLEEKAEELGFRLMIVQPSIRIDIMTEEDYDRIMEERQAEAERMRDWLDSPG